MIDADTHIIEPTDLWTARVSTKKWGDLVPHVKWDPTTEADSWFIGDKLRDVLPAQELGGHGVLIPNEETPAEEVQRARKDFSVAGSLDEVVERIVKSD